MQAYEAVNGRQRLSLITSPKNSHFLLGKQAKRLGTYLERVPSLRLVTCYSRTAEKREAFAAEFGGEAATSFEAAISHPDVQGVLLLTPNSVHAEQVIACAELGKHIFLEKPIADTLSDGYRIRDVCQAAGIVL